MNKNIEKNIERNNILFVLFMLYGHVMSYLKIARGMVP